MASGGGPMNVRPAAITASAKWAPFGQKPVARMNCVGLGRLGRVDELLDDQIRLARRRRPDRDGKIGGAATCGALASGSE